MFDGLGLRIRFLDKYAAIIASVMLLPFGAYAGPLRGNPRFPISMANPAPADAIRNGVLFRKVGEVVTASVDGRPFQSFLSPDAKLILATKNIDLVKADDIANAMQIIIKNCQGPISIDEGGKWVQTSWVCRVGKNEPIHNYFKFNDNPEIDLEFRFDGDKIKRIFAMNIVRLAGTSVLRMDAAEHVPGKR